MELAHMTKADLVDAYVDASDKYWDIVNAGHGNILVINKTKAYLTAKAELKAITDELARRRKIVV